MDTCILIVGNIVDGLDFIGPFLDAEEASNWAEDNVRDEWTVARLTDPTNTVE